MRLLKESNDALVQYHAEQKNNNYSNVSITLQEGLYWLRKDHRYEVIGNILSFTSFQRLCADIVYVKGKQDCMTIA